MRLTQRELFPRVRRESESKDGHGGDEEAGHDQVEEVVEGAAADVDGEGDVHVGLGAALVDDAVPLTRHSCNRTQMRLQISEMEWNGILKNVQLPPFVFR